MLNKIIYGIGTCIYNKDVIAKYKFLKETEKWSLESLQDYQYQKCKEILEIAYNESKYYKRKFDNVGVKPSDFTCLEDIKKFPIVEKQELKMYTNDIQLNTKHEKLRVARTSGSTGEPLVFKRNAEWDASNRAAMFRGYSWHDVNPWDKNGYFWGYDIDKLNKNKTKLLDFLQNRFRMFSYEDKELVGFIKKLERATYLEGYSSAIYETAKMINNRGVDKTKFSKLKMIKGTSEKIFDKYQEEVKRAFGMKIISEYGATESGMIAFECKFGNMHIAMENVLVEVVDNEIVVTNLVSRSFPIIRYKLGDYVEIDLQSKCNCGMEHPIIKNIVGRVGNVIYGYENKYPTFMLYYIFRNMSNQGIILNYQFIQEEKGKMILKIESKLSEYEKNKLQIEIIKYFKDDVEVIIEDESIIKRENGKFKDFLSRIKNEDIEVLES